MSNEPPTHEKRNFQFRSALVDGCWINQPVIAVENGLVVSIHQEPSQEAEKLELVALPGMVNVHSHAFQRGFAGLTEYRTAEHDSFWTWRKLMYQFVSKLDPEAVFVIARQLYLEMLAAGYTWVGEFHYLHNDFNGACYSNLSELTDAVDRAANEAGIGLCHLPVLYQRGGFRGESLSGGQKRFQLSDEQFVELVQQCATNWSGHRERRLGVAIHSLRAVKANIANRVLNEVDTILDDYPIHIHVAEQTKEVDDCVDVHGLRSVEYLFENFEIDPRWCLIHATHLSDNELKSIFRSGAIAGLCPTTEANLGDGFFRALEFLKQGGRVAIGSDSHVSVDLREELRILEYGQRLLHRSRAMLGNEEQSVGRFLYEAAAKGGASAIGVGSGEIKAGNRADFTLVDPEHAAIGSAMGDRLLDRVVFANAGSPIAGVMIAGSLHLSQSNDFSTRLKASTREFNAVLRRIG